MTAVFPLNSHPESSLPGWDTDRILEQMDEWGVEEAFVRSQFKAAPERLAEGSHILERSHAEVDTTIRSLLDQLSAAGWDHGGGLVLRERLDLNFCMGSDHDYCHPEVRFFVEDGTILGFAPSLDTDFVCSQRYSHLESVLDTVADSFPINEARTVAEEVPDGTWGVDFVMDTTGTWYLIEMGLNAVRWDEGLDDWINHCDHADFTAYSPREMHSAAFRIARTYLE